jgi:hypothetical protein
MKGLHYVMNTRVMIQPGHKGPCRATIEMEEEDDIWGEGETVNEAAANVLEVLAKRLRSRSEV